MIIDEKELFTKKPVAAVCTENTNMFEGAALKAYIYDYVKNVSIPQNYSLAPNEIGTVISHHCAHRPIRKAALQSLPQIINANYVIIPWQKGTKDRRQSGLIGAPILIDNVKYLCTITLKRNAQKVIKPYSITLKDENGQVINEEKVTNDIKVLDSISGNSSFGNTHSSKDTASLDVNAPSDAKVSVLSNVQKKDSPNLMFRFRRPYAARNWGRHRSAA
ncbi:MAG: hypothetical protein IJS30_00035 [Bacteroidales bacterium]|nr:hypothetical protein [Bacteroidales bacterium]